MTRPPIESILVVVPIHDEEDLLPRCLTALSESIALVYSTVPNAPTISVKLVLDACTDASEAIASEAIASEAIASGAIASRSEFTVVCTDANNVGEARSRGVALGLTEHGDRDPGTLWIANTDGDSSVPANWLCEQIELAGRGVDLMIGTVRPDFAELSVAQREAWERTHVPGQIGRAHV